MLTIEQIALRRKGLGATDAAVVLGLSPYKTPYELYLEKMGRKEDEAILPESCLRLRHAHEETIAREYAFQKEVKLKRVNKTIIHKQLPFMLCNLDRVVIGQKKIIECKSSTGWKRAEWGETGSDIAPIQYLIQVQHQYACTNYETADIAALIDSDDFRILPQVRNEKIIKKIEEACEHFWVEHVLKDVPPPPTNRGDLKLMYPTNNGNLIEATPDILSYIDEVNRLKKEIDTLCDDKKRIEKEIIQFIADNDGVTESGKVIVTYRANKNGVRSLSIKERI
jgi:putative phage-type endonuclease